MRSFILSAVAVVIVSGGIFWFVSSDPHAKERLLTEVSAIKMDIGDMTRKTKNLPVTVVESFI